MLYYYHQIVTAAAGSSIKDKKDTKNLQKVWLQHFMTDMDWNPYWKADSAFIRLHRE